MENLAAHPTACHAFAPLAQLALCHRRTRSVAHRSSLPSGHRSAQGRALRHNDSPDRPVASPTPRTQDEGGDVDEPQPVVRYTFSISEAAEILGISRSAAYESARRGDLPVIRFGRRVVVTRATIEDLLSTPIVESAPRTARRDRPRRYRWVRAPQRAALRSIF